MRIPPRPTVYELNTAVWLERLGGEDGRPLQLDRVPASRWDALAALPVDAVWLMGVWQRSPAGTEIARLEPGVDRANRAALPDLRPDDVIGSAYCVRDYVVDARFGGPNALATAREALADRGLGLILDYVPNHVALDHPWVSTKPACLLAGSEEELAAQPDAFVRAAGGVFANGRDPYFPPWRDVVQLNAFSTQLRDAAADTLLEVGAQCDGLRCDMAMLMTNEVFARTWGERAGPPPPSDYWPQLIGRVKAAHPHLLFMAEAYWDMEWTLQQQGFDLCYDKRLYDRLANESADSVRVHLQAGFAYQERLIRFIENHDEPRAAATFAPGQARAAAVVMSTLPGARLYHDGQLDGRRTHIPVSLGRGPNEPTDNDLRAFYERLIRGVSDADLRHGVWRLCECSGWPDNQSWAQLLAWGWSCGSSHHLVVVNYGGSPSQGQVHLPWPELQGREWELTDRLSEARFTRDGGDLNAQGLYVSLHPWASHLLSFAASGPGVGRGETAAAGTSTHPAG
jgi:Alpha amylase, catalytic domain